MQNEKPTLLTLRRKYNAENPAHLLTSTDLALEAKIPLALAYAVEIGGFANLEVAQKVVDAYNRLTKRHVRLTDISLNHSKSPLRSYNDLWIAI